MAHSGLSVQQLRLKELVNILQARPLYTRVVQLMLQLFVPQVLVSNHILLANLLFSHNIKPIKENGIKHIYLNFDLKKRLKLSHHGYIKKVII